jgi:hypothetical protein
MRIITIQYLCITPILTDWIIHWLKANLSSLFYLLISSNYIKPKFNKFIKGYSSLDCKYFRNALFIYKSQDSSVGTATSPQGYKESVFDSRQG